MNLYLILGINSVALGGLLFLLSSGFSLIFGLMRIPNLTHGSLFMLGGYFGASFLLWGKLDFWLSAVLAALIVALIGGVIERLLLRRLAGNELAQVLVTLGISFMVADLCLLEWTGNPISVPTPPALQGLVRFLGIGFSLYRLAVIVVAAVIAAALWLLLERTRLGAMIRAGVDDPDMARIVGIRVSRLFTLVFCLGAGLAGLGGIVAGPILSVYPGLDTDMLPLALVVVILGGTGSLVGSFIGSFAVATLYNYGQALLPELAYFVLFLPMVLMLALRPRGLFGRQAL
jgi:branched-chain amino acid transport system permease protein